MRKSSIIKIIIAAALVLAIFVAVRPGEPEWTNVIRPGDTGYYDAQSLGDSDVPLSGGGSFVFSGEDEESPEDSNEPAESADEQSEEPVDQEAGLPDPADTGAAENAEDELVSRTVQAEIVGGTQTGGGFISRIRNILRLSGNGSGLNANDDIILSGMVPGDAVAEATRENIRIKGENVLAAYDIKIFADDNEKEEGSAWQPTEDSITVSIKSDALRDASIVDIYHMEDEHSDAVFIGSVRTSDGIARFEAESFSVYVIAVHEDADAVTPRVEVHYTSKAGSPSEKNGAPVYSAEPYYFGNKAGDRQSSIILSNGEKLPSIEAPESSGDSNFLGWYTVVPESNTGDAIVFSWPENMMRVDAGASISVSDNGDGTLTWAFGGSGAGSAGGTAEMDEEGCAHVYLAPIYDNYCFINFHLGARGSNTADSILSRKLIAVGSTGKTDVLISDITAASEDPDRRTFIGWEYESSGADGGSDWNTVRTLDNDGKVVSNREGESGSYVTADGSDIDLYPVFAEIRWINFNVGESHNGAAYVAPRYIYSSDNVEGEIYPADRLVTAKRMGYTFSGWFTEPDGRGIQITDGDGKVVDKTYSESTEYTDSNGNTKNGKAFEVKDGSLYVYNALDRLTLYAGWKANSEAEYKVIIWKQKVTDDKEAADDEKTYDYYTYFERVTDDTSKPVSPDADDLGYAVSDPEDFTGFHLGRYDHDVMPDPQGTTILNVYYDRNVMEIRFLNYPDYTPASGSLNSNTQYYALIDGSYVSLSRYTSTGWLSSTTSYYYLSYSGEPYTGTVYSRQRSGLQYTYYATTSYSYNNTYYGVIDGYYRQLSWTKYAGDNYYIQSSSGMTWSGLFEQTFEKNGYSWDDVASYQWKENKTNTIQTLLTGFTHEESPYELTCSNQGGNPAIYHYKQNLDGTYSADAAYTAYSSQVSGTFNFSNKFEGFTVASYSQEFNNAGAGNAVREGSQASVTYPIHVFHSRNSGYSLTFTSNYPKGTDTTALQGEPTVYTGLAYEQPLSAYAGQAAPPAPENYTFEGWYEDASGTVPFDFEHEIMPAGNKVVYAKWSLVKYLVRIDPAGGIMDHIDYTNEDYRRILEPTGLTGRTYNTSCATYFNNTATEYISLDEGIVRPYIEISGAEAASMEAGSVYRYVNMQFIEDYGSYAPDARNAVYILDTRESIDAYYKYYAKVITDSGDGTALPQALWESKYLSAEKYRKLRPGENYKMIGWYEIGSDGSSGSNTYDFESPTLHQTTLRAAWRLEGGYTLRYTTEYTAPNGDVLTGNLDSWTDPAEGGMKYVDQGETLALQEPAAIRVNGRESDEYQFLGWQIVKVDMIAGAPHYTALEPGVYYTAGSRMTVKAKFSDDNMVIHMQAVYEKRNEAKRRPDVVQLMLDASTDAAGAGRGYINENAGNGALPVTEHPGFVGINTDDHLYERKPTQMLMGDYQYNAAIHLYRYATDITVNGLTGDTLDPPGTNWFEHSEGYRLIGFDNGSADTDFIPDYAADAVIGVSPGEPQTLYAVWEPMVYMTFVNDTGRGDVTFSIDGTGQSALNINRVDGPYERTALDPSGTITVGAGETVRLAVPQGSGETMTITGRDDLGTGYSLTAASTLDGEKRPLTGTITGTESDFTRVANGETFGFSDTLVTDPEGIVITFTAELAPHTLVLQDNYNGQGGGGGTKEIQFSEKTDGTVYYNEENVTSYGLPSTSTRLGYEFAGWDTDPASDNPAYSEESGWTIEDLAGFFGGRESVTLYAVWKANAEASTVYVWNEVPEPGDQNKEFDVKVSFSGAFTYQQNTNGRSSGWSGNKSDTISADNCSGTAALEGRYSLKHGEYLKITTIKDESHGASSRPSVKVTVQRYGADGKAAGKPEELSWTWDHINYDNTGANYRYRNFSFTATDVSVIQGDYSVQYDTAVNIAAQTTDYPLAADAASRSVRWSSSFAGGTVIFSNTRRTADVTVKNVLLPVSAPAEEFAFTAAFADVDGDDNSDENGSSNAGNDVSSALQYESYRLEASEKKMISGSAASEWKLEGIPTGAVLEISANSDPDRFTVITGGMAVSPAAGEEQSEVPDLDADNDNVFRFVVTGDTIVNYTHTLKSQKIKLAVTDDSDPGVPLDSAEFTFPGVYEGTRYSAASTGIVWEGTAYAGTFRLTEIGMYNRSYDKMTESAEITVSASGVKAADGTDNIEVSGPDEEDVYTITVINSRLMKVTVKNVVDGEDTSGTFGFTVSLRNGSRPVVRDNVTDALGTDQDGRLEFTLVHNQSVDLYVPRNAEITIEQTEDPAYYTQYQVDEGDMSSGRTAKLRNISSDASVVFINEANPPAPTGVRTRTVPFILLVCGAAAILLLMKMRRRTEPEKDSTQDEAEKDTTHDKHEEDGGQE